jgi:hypothetical protein
MKYVVVCLMDDGLYIQTSRRHFEFKIDALRYAQGIASNRFPSIFEITEEASDFIQTKWPANNLMAY